MDRVYRQSDRKLSDLTFAAIAIGIGQREHPHQLHIGIFHAAEGEPAKMIHLPWHDQISNDDPEQDYVWVAPAIPAPRLRQLASLCRRILRKNEKNGLPYGFGTPSDVFDEQTGAYLFQDSHSGLTCASFVLAVFHHANLPLARYESWPSGTAKDVRWQQWVISMLQRSQAPDAHIKAVTNDIGTVRFKPQQVAACGANEDLPVEHDDANSMGQEIRRQIFEHHLQTLAVDLPNDKTRDLFLNSAQQQFENHQLTPCQVSASDESVRLEYKHEFQPKVFLILDASEKGETKATIIKNQTRVALEDAGTTDDVISAFLSM